MSAVSDDTATTTTTANKANFYWPEVRKTAEADPKRYELILAGAEISKRIEENGGFLDSNIYKIKHLNLLEVAKTKLSIMPRQISHLEHLTSLLFHTNELTSIPAEIGKLTMLKNIDFSNNKLTSLPDELKHLKEAFTINFSGNQLSSLFPLDEMSKLAVLDISRNKFSTNFLEATSDFTKLENLSHINASFNELEQLSESLVDLPAIKTLNFENNSLLQVPANLCQCLKLKDLLLKTNKLKDNRLKKLVESDKVNMKSVVDYLERIYVEESKNKAKTPGGVGKKVAAKKGGANNNGDNVIVDYDLVKVMHYKHEGLNGIELVYTESVQDSRPFILCAILRQIDLKTPGNLKKFLNIQTKIHEETCQKRTLATIATHDLENVKSSLSYEAAEPESIELVPLGRVYPLKASEFYEKLMDEAEAERKQKKRNQLSGIYKYLTLLENKTKFAYIKDKENSVISLPPLTNAEKTKMSANTTNILIEITSNESTDTCKKVMEELLVEMITMGITSKDELGTEKTQETQETDGKLRHTLIMQQVKIVDSKGNLKTVYPSRVDLQFGDSNKMRVTRLYDE
jgi:hypothetical protein